MRIFSSKRARMGLMLFCLCLFLPVAAGADWSGGLMVSVNGEVVVRRGEVDELAKEGYVLREGDTIVVRMGGECSGFTPVGEAFDLKGPAEMQLAAASGLGGDLAAWVRLQLADWIGESRRQPLRTRTVRDWSLPTEAPTQIIPASGGRVRPADARLYWSEVPGVGSYTLTIAPSAGEEVQRVVRDNGAVLEELVPGEEYVWKVQPEAEGWDGESGWRDFVVMTPEEEVRLDQAMEGLGDLEAGVLLLSSGLHEEAIYRFDVAVASASQVRSARMWRARAFADIGLYKQAYEDLIEARGNE
ncbi:MAG: tetratricopeptide repeat protein [Candidatus Eisenbacteria bacterium]